MMKKGLCFSVGYYINYVMTTLWILIIMECWGGPNI